MELDLGSSNEDVKKERLENGAGVELACVPGKMEWATASNRSTHGCSCLPKKYWRSRNSFIRGGKEVVFMVTEKYRAIGRLLE